MTQTTHAPTLLRLASVFKAFGGVQALTDVSFEPAAREVHALIGENGRRQDHAHQDRHRLTRPTPARSKSTDKRSSVTIRRAKQLGIAAIYQQPLFAELTVAENIAVHRASAPGERSAGANACCGPPSS